MRTKFWIVALFIAALSILPSCTAMAAKDKEKEGEEKDEVKVKIDQVPAAVKKTLDKESDNAKIDEVDKETDDGKTIYEADVKMNGHNYEIKVAEDGTLISKKLDEGEGEKGEKDKGKEKDEDEAKEKK
jgi:hypothetical protein